MSTTPIQGTSKASSNPASSPPRPETPRMTIDWSGIFGYDIFVSYKRADASGFAAALVHELYQRDYRCFLDRSDAPAGVPLDDHIRVALRKSKVLVVIVTRGALESPWVTEELQVFCSGRKRPVIALDVDHLFSSLAVSGSPWGRLRGTNPIWLDVRASEISDNRPSDELVQGIEQLFTYIRANLRRRFAVSIAGGLLGIAACVAVFTAVRENRARKAEVAARLEADGQRNIAESEKKKALDAAATATRERNAALIGESRVLAIQAEESINAGKVWKGISLALEALPSSAEAPERPYVPAAEGALRQGLLRLREKAIFHAGSDGVTHIALSPNGRWLATMTSWSEVRLWDVASSRHSRLVAHRVTSIHDGAFAARLIVFSPTSARLAVAFWDKSVHLYRTSAASKPTILPHASGVNSVAFHPGGDLIATASDDGGVRIWHADTGAPAATLKGHTAAVNHIEFDSSGEYLVSSSNDKTVRIWRWRDATCLHVVTSRLAVSFAHFSPDRAKFLAVTKPDAVVIGAPIRSAPIADTAALYSTESGRLVAGLKGHADYINSAEFSADGTRIVTASEDGSARTWSTEDGRLLDTFSDLPSEAYTSTHGMAAAHFLDGVSRIVTAGMDSKIRIWNSGIPQAGSVIAVHDGGINDLAVSSDGSIFATGSFDGTARIWAAHSREDLSIITDKDSRFGPMAALLKRRTATFHFDLPEPPSMRRVVIGLEGPILTRSKASGPVPLVGHTGQVSRADFSPDGRFVATMCGRSEGTMGFYPRGHDYTARVWDADSGRLVAILADHAGAVERVVFNPRQTTLATASHDGKARIWSLPDGKLLSVIDAGKAPVYDIAFSPDGATLVTVSAEGTGRVWRATDGSLLTTLSGHTKAIEHVEFSADGRKIVTASEDGTARIWDSASGTQLTVLKFGGELNFAAFVQRDKLVVTAMVNPAKYIGDGAFGSFLDERTALRTVSIWDAGSGEKLEDLNHEQPIEALQISSDGSQLFILSGDVMMGARLRIWDLFPSLQVTVAAARDAAPKSAVAPDLGAVGR
jgi:WD40 repeat protein